jgi:hypothetical protein
MPRTIVYPHPPIRNFASGALSDQPDRYGDKLVKYIPAEALAFYLPMYTLMKDQGPGSRYAAFIVAVLGVPLYLFTRSDRSSPPNWYYYVISVLAFVAWAIGTSTLGQDLFALSEVSSKFVTGCAVFLLPAVDALLTRLKGSWH